MRMRFFLRPYMLSLGAVLLQIFLLNALELLKPWPLQIVVDHVVSAKPWPPFVARLLPAPPPSPQHLLLIACLALVLIFLAHALLTLAYNHAAIRLGQAMVGRLRDRLYAHVQRLSLAFHARHQQGDLMMRINHDSFAVQTMVMNGMLPILSASILLIGILAVLIRIDRGLTIAALAVLPPLWIANRLFNRRIAAAAEIARDRDAYLFSLVQWGLSAIKHVQAFTREAAEHRRFVAASTTALGSALRLYSWQTLYTGFVTVVNAGGTALVIYLGARAVLAHQLTLGELLVFTAYLAQLYTPVNQITQSAGLIAGARIGWTRCAEILEAEPELPDGRESFPAGGPRQAIEWRDVAFGYQAGLPVLTHIDCRVQAGSTVALVGASGAGKSTMLSLLARFFDANEGRILIDGRDIREFTLESLRRNIAMLLQPPLVFPLTVRDNIAYGRPDASDAEICQAARLAHLDAMIETLPLRYDTPVGEGGITLSEGEKQRLALARALLRDAPILILDEPTSALDAESEALVMHAVGRLAEKRTIFIIAHRLSTVREADQILVLKDGRIAEAGSFDELLRANGVFAALCRLQFGARPEGGDRVAREPTIEETLSGASLAGGMPAGETLIGA